MKEINKTVELIGALDNDIMEEAQKRLDNLLKPQGSLGKLESIAKRLAGISGELNYEVKGKSIMIMSGDNGVVEEKVSSFPQEVSLLVAETMASGISGVAVLAKHAGASLRVVDLGLAGDVKHEDIINRKIKRGTANMLKGPAMSREEVVKAIEIGIEETNKAIDAGVNLLGTGEVGIGNTTSSSAVLFALTEGDIDELVGRGAGLTDEGLANKKRVIKEAIEVNKPVAGDPIDVLAKVGGFDLAGLTGCYLAAAARRVPIVIDGFISGAAAVAAYKLAPAVRDYMFASHLTEEPGGKMIADILELEPMLTMNMRLGEGTGCALAFNIIEAATKIMNEMGSFADIGM